MAPAMAAWKVDVTDSNLEYQMATHLVEQKAVTMAASMESMTDLC